MAERRRLCCLSNRPADCHRAGRARLYVSISRSITTIPVFGRLRARKGIAASSGQGSGSTSISPEPPLLITCSTLFLKPVFLAR